MIQGSLQSVLPLGFDASRISTRPKPLTPMLYHDPRFEDLLEMAKP